MLSWLSNDKYDTSQPGFGPSANVYEKDRPKLNPDEYQRSRKKLKVAVIEFYRSVFHPLSSFDVLIFVTQEIWKSSTILEWVVILLSKPIRSDCVLIQTLNVIGFGKALKKFEKVTLITVQNAYTREKVMYDSLAIIHAVLINEDRSQGLCFLRGGEGNDQRD
jgi:hypothetical protein